MFAYFFFYPIQFSPNQAYLLVTGQRGRRIHSKLAGYAWHTSENECGEMIEDFSIKLKN
jgi:hypothetical protein